MIILVDYFGGLFWWFKMMTSSKVSSVYCKHQWVLLCWREGGGPGFGEVQTRYLCACVSSVACQQVFLGTMP